MCLAIPGQVVELGVGHQHLATVDIAGVQRNVNIGLLASESLHEGDWVLIHVGFAMSKIDEQEAARALGELELMGETYADEVRAVAESRIW